MKKLLLHIVHIVFYCLVIVFSVDAPLLSSQEVQNIESRQKGPYLGQTPPGAYPELFAPGIVSTGHHEHSAPAFAPDGKSIYWAIVEVPFQRNVPHKIMMIEESENGWGEPGVAPFSGTYSEDGPNFPPAGNKLYYYSKRPNPGETVQKQYADIWFVQKQGSRWSEPVRLPPIINTEKLEANPSLTQDGTLFFLQGVNEPEVQYDIYMSKNKNGEYQLPVLLNESINSPYHDYTPCVSSDGQILIFSSVNRPDGFGSGDLYICFQKPDGEWSVPKNLGSRINTEFNERFPALSPDGKYLFFVSNLRKESNLENLNVPQNGYCDIYWVDASFLQKLNRFKGDS